MVARTMIWRRVTANDHWHFCTNCPKWPTTGAYEEADRLPLVGEMCRDCRVKKDRGECRAEPKPAAPK